MSDNYRTTAAALARVAAAWDGAAIGVALAICAVGSLAKYFSTSASLRRIAAAPSPRISDLRSLLLPSPSDVDRDGNLVVVRGTVSAVERPIIAESSGERGVIVQRTQTCLYNQRRGIFGWSFDFVYFLKPLKQQRSSSLKSVPFVLVEGGRLPHSGSVHVLLDDSAHPLPLRKVYGHLHPVQAIPYTIINAIFGIRYPVALLDEEKILPVGKEITAVGFCSTRDGTLEIKSCSDLPYFLSNLTKVEIETSLDVKTKFQLWSGVVLGALSISILCYAVIRNWWRWKAWREMRRRNQELHEALLQSSSGAESDVPDGELCVICLMRRKRSAFIPCGHLLCCPSCAMHVERDSSPKCPLCRQSIRSSIRIYDS